MNTHSEQSQVTELVLASFSPVNLMHVIIFQVKKLLPSKIVFTGADTQNRICHSYFLNVQLLKKHLNVEFN
jgi:hypothetical protein